ncbi:MAG: hypothetical protein Q7R85_00400 [bacterium]|nr:hypothetical protein [bacterium]
MPAVPDGAAGFLFNVFLRQAQEIRRVRLPQPTAVGFAMTDDNVRLLRRPMAVGLLAMTRMRYNKTMEQKFDEHGSLEADMKRLAVEVERQKEIESREVIKAALGAKIREGEPAGGAGHEAAASAGASPLPAYSDDATPEMRLKVEQLVDVAWHKGIDAAVAEARALAKQKDGPALLDMFHDALTGKLHEEMVRRGLL